MIISEIVKFLEDLAPIEYSLDWDNSGLQVGELNKEIKKVGIALTPTVKIIEEAISKGCNLLITHHPLIFRAIKSINTNQPIGKSIELALKNDLTIYTLHTNFDSVSTGLNYTIAKDLGLDNIDILSESGNIEMLKLVTFVPEEYTLKVVNAISEAGAGNVGKFSHRSYIAAGIATFAQGDNKIEDLETPNKESEDRLEIVVPKNKLKQVINALNESHPYDEVVYDLYKLENNKETYGIGTIGEFYTPFKLAEIIKMIKRNLNISNLTYVGESNKMIEKVAICTGSGCDFMKLAKNKGADLYITGDIKYHTAIDAQEIDMALIDASHYSTEIIAIPFLTKYLKNNFHKKIEIVELVEKNPFSYA
ncbi:MAG: Nif3-like dinuclear metal center hexameric protein [Candidatus Sericytochromatia bacterium]|nr:Nif3-like dinuclear metal center hexameric protein [Candidatus Sericytochromatia bacterium]